jgi:hypothetical protein
MALFSRRDKRTDAAESSDAVETAAEATGAAAADAPVEDVPAVGISVTSFGGLGAASAPPLEEPEIADAPPSIVPGAQVAPPETETVPGLRDNVLLREALATLGPDPEPTDLLRVGRQVLQNHLFLRVKGDARELLAAGEELPLAVARDGDDQWVLAFSSGAALQASVESDGDADTSAMGQPVMAVLSHVLSGPYAGLIIDPVSAPARLMMPRELIQRMVDQADPNLALKSLLAAPRTPEVTDRIARAMVDAPLFVAVNRAQPDASGEERMGVAEARDPDGTRILELYTHPLEVVAMGRQDQPMPFTAQQLAGALVENPQLGGVILDAAGPWIRLGRDELGPVLALAEG